MADEPMDFSNWLSDHAQQGSRGQRPAAAPYGNRKVVVIPLCIDRQFTSLALTYKYFLVGPRVLANVGPQLQDIVGQARGKDFTTNFKWKLVGDKSVDGEVWEQFGTVIIPEQTAAGQVVATPHAARTDYANNIRFALGVCNVSGSNPELGNITSYAALTFAT